MPKGNILKTWTLEWKKWFLLFIDIGDFLG